MTFLPGRVGSMPSDKAPVPVAKPVQPWRALRHARTFQTETHPGRPVVLHSEIHSRPYRPDQSAFPVLCGGTTTCDDLPPHAKRCGRSRSLGWTLHGNVSFRERPSEILLVWCRQRPTDHSQCDK